ncbi:MAG TPA: isoprenylcysteine carboxylmethyltransferase family protein [Usitatibacter sp.]|jgi:protein-S-isoprenylcysteine O-methyltransferase Ste14|nr:isoprenylcysteine carboxylmethyltransferase family protein [Usitatibacter sp.]
MGPTLSLLYGVIAYLFFLATFIYAVGFAGDILVPTSVDRGVQAPLAEALLVDLSLLAFFALQHSVMARRGFKRWWTRIVPPQVERSTYVLAASAALALLLWQWRPIAEPVLWSVDDPLAVFCIRGVFWLGWGVLLLSTFLLNHFELFGLQQVYLGWSGRSAAATEFRTPLLYRHVRHPIYLGFLLAFWAAPVMTAGHLVFSVGATGYILVGIWFEERDLIAQFGERYRQYRERVGMLWPRWWRTLRP